VVVREPQITIILSIPFILAVLVLGILSSVVYAVAISKQEAENIFNRHCSVCHNGVTATDFNQLLEKLKNWAAKYPSIDVAIEREYGAKNYDMLMEEMKRMTPTISDEEFEKLYNFFKSYFEEMKQAKATQLTVTVTLTVVETVTETSPVYTYVTLTVKEGAPDETAKLISKASLVGALIVAIAVILLIYRIKTR